MPTFLQPSIEPEKSESVRTADVFLSCPAHPSSTFPRIATGFCNRDRSIRRIHAQIWRELGTNIKFLKRGWIVQKFTSPNFYVLSQDYLTATRSALASSWLQSDCAHEERLPIAAKVWTRWIRLTTCTCEQELHTNLKNHIINKNNKMSKTMACVFAILPFLLGSAVCELQSNIPIAAVFDDDQVWNDGKHNRKPDMLLIFTKMLLLMR